MSLSINLIGTDRLKAYASIPMVCHVRSILDVEEINGERGNPRLKERHLQVPYTKDYDAYPEGGPLGWPQRFDLSNWGIWMAFYNGEAVGGAAVARNTPGMDMLEDRSDLAVLWDIRVRPTSKRCGVGTALFLNAIQWAKSKGCRLLKIETQNVNVDACRFYEKMGCFLAQIDRDAYSQQPEIASEVMLVWHREL